MTEPSPHREQAGPSRRIYAYWAAALALLLALGLLCRTFLAPYLQVRAAAKRYLTANDPDAAKLARLEVERLGGPEAALRKLSLYLRLPEGRQRRQVAACLLAGCGRQALPRLGELLEGDQECVRAGAAWALGEVGGARAAGLLRAALKDRSSYVRGAAEIALLKIQGKYNPAPVRKRLQESKRAVQSGEASP